MGLNESREGTEVAMNVSVKLVDSYGRTTTRQFQTTETVLATALTTVATFMGTLQAVSALGNQKEDISVTTVDVDAATALSNKDIGATLHCVLDNGKGYALKIPGVKDSMINVDGSVKLDDAAIIAYVANFKSGGKFTVSEGNLIASVAYGELDG